MTKGKNMTKVSLLFIEWGLIILLFYYAGTAIIIAEWYILALWLTRGATGPFKAFFVSHFTPVSLISYLFIWWIATPIITAAFQKCIDNRFSAAELDVQMLGDGTIVVLHDDNLKRTTGVDKNVWEVTYDDIKDIDNGSFFSESFSGTTAPASVFSSGP